MAKLTAKGVESETEEGLHGDGEGLYLGVSRSGGRSWILRTRVFGKPCDLGLGGVRLVSLAEARDKARELRKIARAGGDPAAHRKRGDITFAEATRRAHESRKPGWRSIRHGENWLSSIERYAFPHIG